GHVTGVQTCALPISQARNLRCVPAEAHDAVTVDCVGVDSRVLGMDMNESLAELPDAADRIDVLPDQVRRIEVQTESRRGQLREQIGRASCRAGQETE